MSSFSENTSANPEAPKTLLVDVPVDGTNSALNLMIAFLSVAQKRGTFNMQESAKLWECISVFTQEQDQTQGQAQAQAQAKGHVQTTSHPV
jgi:hypothetical protein